MKVAILTILLLGVAGQQSSRAAQAGHPFMAYGPTRDSCGSWATSTEAEKQLFQWWILGFVSGAGFANQTPLRETDSKGITAWVDKYCADHPLSLIAKAAIDLVAELRQ